jgi:hypothetical protein
MPYKDLQPQKVVLADMLLTANKKQLLETMIANQMEQASKHNALTDEVEATFTSVKQLIDQGQLADDVDIEAIRETLTAMNALLSEAGAGANILSGIGQIYTELNRREEVKTFEVPINTANGKVDFDITSFGFADVTEYSAMVSFYGAKPLTAAVEKSSNTSVKVIITDHTKWEFNDDRFFDGTTEPATAVVQITRTPVQIAKTFTEVDGDSTTVGQ